MSYRIRFTLPDGRTGLWAHEYQTRETAQAAIDDRLGDTGFSYAVEEVPEPGSTAAHHVEILRARVNGLEAMVKTLRDKLNETLTDNDDIHRELAFALDLGSAMREAMRNGEWRAGHDRSMASSATSGWDRWKASLAASLQGTAKALEASGEGGDSDRRRLEALERWIKGHAWRRIRQVNGYGIVVESHNLGIELAATTLAALADKLMEKDAKP